jgi:hypothetical protein
MTDPSLRELDGPRLAEYDRSEQAIGITKELWFLASLPGGDALVGYIESGDFGKAVGQFGASKDPFDVWFKLQQHSRGFSRPGTALPV